MHKKTAKQILWTVKMSNQNPSIVCIILLELMILPKHLSRTLTTRNSKAKACEVHIQPHIFDTHSPTLTQARILSDLLLQQTKSRLESVKRWSSVLFLRISVLSSGHWACSVFESYKYFAHTKPLHSHSSIETNTNTDKGAKSELMRTSKWADGTHSSALDSHTCRQIRNTKVFFFYWIFFISIC